MQVVNYNKLQQSGQGEAMVVGARDERRSGGEVCRGRKVCICVFGVDLAGYWVLLQGLF